MNTIKYIFLLFFLHLNIYALDSIEILNPNIIVNNSGYFKTTKSLTPEQALQEKFFPLSEKAISYGFDHDTYWFMFNISNNSNEKQYLDSKDLLSNYQDLFIYKDNKLIRHEKSGFYFPNEQKQIKTFSSRFELESNPQNIIYLVKIDSVFMRLTSFSFGTEKEIEKDWTILLMIIVATTAIAFGFLIYNLVLYYFTLDKSFLYYIVYMIGMLGSNLLSLGYLPFILLEINGKLNVTLWIFAMIFYTIGLVFFTINFLNLEEKHKNIKKIFITLLLINIFFTPFHIYPNIIPNSQTLWLLTIQILLIFSIFIGIKRCLEGYKPAKYYLMATGGGVTFAFCFVILIENNGIYYNFFTLNFPNIALIWDLILFSLALAYRMKLLKEESTKNERLALIKSKQSSLGELSGNLAHQWRTPLAELGSINTNIKAKLKFSVISKEELLEKLETNKNILNHLSQTINTFQSFFQNSNIETKFNVNDEIKRSIDFVNDSMKNNYISINFSSDNNYFLHGNANEFSQIILNIVLNAKDALCEKNIEKKYINIELKKFNDKFKIEIEDNAGGIKIEPIESIFESYITSKDKGIGIGLFIVKTIVEQKFNGKIFVSNTKVGARFHLSF